MPVSQEVIDLIERFKRNREAYLSSEYNEAQVRLELINPFFKALGWDMYNEAGYAEAYKDVVHEATIKIGGATKTNHEKALIQPQIDQLVYEIYNLTYEEIRIVEEGTK
jgi:hypothetical protein